MSLRIRDEEPSSYKNDRAEVRGCRDVNYDRAKWVDNWAERMLMDCHLTALKCSAWVLRFCDFPTVHFSSKRR